MTNAYLDENGVATIIGISNTDGAAIRRIAADPSTHILNTNNDTTGTDRGNNGNNAYRDENERPVLIAVSSADGKTPIELYVDSVNNLLVNST